MSLRLVVRLRGRACVHADAKRPGYIFDHKARPRSPAWDNYFFPTPLCAPRSVLRTNNDRESEFRDVTRRLLSTTGQVSGAKRLLLREGMWKLIPGPASLSETIAAISQV